MRADKYQFQTSVHNKRTLVIGFINFRHKELVFYKWLHHTPSENEKWNQGILKEITSLNEKVDGIYGYRRMTLNISRTLSKSINHKRVYRLMKINGIQAVIRRKSKKYKASPPQHLEENVLNRDFHVDKPNEKWLTDVTEMKYGASQKAYLSAILDLHTSTIHWKS